MNVMSPEHTLSLGFTRLAKFLPLGHSIALLAVLLGTYTPPIYLNRYSTRAFFVIVFLALTLPVAIAMSRLSMHFWQVHIAKRLLRHGLWFRVGMILISLLVLAILWSLSLAPTTSYLIVRIYITGVFVIVSSLIISTTIRFTLDRKVLLVLGGFLLMTAGMLTRTFPFLLWTDEGFTGSISLTWVQTGELVLGFLQPAHVELYSLYFGLVGLWQQVFGSSLEAVRFANFVIALVALGLMGWGLRWRYGGRIAWQVVLLASFVVLRLNYARHDTWVMVWFALMLLAYIQAIHRQRRWAHLLVGLFAGLSLDGHPNMYRFALAIGVLYTWDYGIALWRTKRWVWYRPFFEVALGGVLGVTLYMGFYLSFTQNFDEQLGSQFVVTIESIVYLLGEQIAVAVSTAPILIGGTIIAIWALWTRQIEDETGCFVVRLLLVGTLVLALTYDRYRIHYQLHLVVPMMMLLGMILHRVAQYERRVADSSFLLLIAVNGIYLVQGVTRSSQSYDEALVVAQEIAPLLETDAHIMGIDPMWYGFSHNPNFTEINAPARYQLETGLPVDDVWNTFSPEAIILNRGYPIPMPEGTDAYMQATSMHLVACWDTQRAGRIELWARPDIAALYEGDCVRVE
jgi:hypothetical protein